jgi:HK97 family phage portal protein
MRVKSVAGSDGLLLPDPSMFAGGGRYFAEDGRAISGDYPAVNVRAGGFDSPKILSLSTTLDQRETSERPYEENVWVRSAIKAISSGFQRLQLRMFSGDPSADGSQELEDHPILRLIARPNRHMTGRELWQSHATNYKLDGESFWFLANEQGLPVRVDETSQQLLEMPAQIIPVRGELVEHRVGKSGWPVAFRYSVKRGGESLTWPEAAVIQFRDYDPYNLVRGLGDVRAVMREVDLYFQAFRYMDGAVRNNGDPGGFLIFEEKLGIDELERRQAAAEDEFGNAENARRIKVLDRGAKFMPNPVKPSDMAYENLSSWLRDSILSALGVPGPVVGIYDAATYNNVQTAHREMWTGPNGILSLAEMTADVLEYKLLPRLERVLPGVSELVPVFDSGQVEVLQEDVSDKLKIASEIAATGVGITANEMLQRLGVEVDPFEEGDRKWVAMGLTELGSEQPEDTAERMADILERRRAEDELDEVYGSWRESVNMSASELERWAENECSRKASVDSRAVIDRNLNLLRKKKGDWGSKEIKDAKRTISFIARMKGMEQGEPAVKGCPSKRDISLKNWAFDPGKGSRSLRSEDGDPQPEELRSPPCRQAGESRRDCLDRKISEIADENPEWQNDQVVAVAIDMCEKSCRCGETAQRREFSPAIEELLEPFTKRVARWFERYETAQLAHLRKIANGGRATIAEHLRDVVDEVFDPQGISDEAFDALLLENSVWAAALEREVRTALREVWAQAIAEAHGEVGGSLLTMSDASVIEALTSQKTRLVEGVTSRLSNRVKNVLAKGLSDAGAAKSLRELVKDELPALTDELRQVFGTKEARAATIVQTETGIASNTARYAQYQRSGVTKIRWSSAKDEAVRPSHMALDGDTIEIGSTFANGLRFPQDPQAANAAEVVNCRCRFFAAEYAQPE